MITLVDKLQKIQFIVIKNRIKMEEKRNNNSPLELYNISFLLLNASKKNYPTIYNDAIFQVRNFKY